jgi:ferredoxin--NADP+ reductase
MSQADGDAKARVAIIGSGPAGSYAAAHLLRHSAPALHVDLFERLPTPWGLVRAGVAPDHPKIKSVTRVYEKTAAHERLRYFGNVELGRDITVDDLRAHYNAIVYAVGTPVDRELGIPGEELERSYAATDFVGWYNGHPDYTDQDFDLRGERAIVIGAGNVALDVARMLMLTDRELACTDVADHALRALAASTISEVLVIARRGIEQAAFTNPELLELAELSAADVAVHAEDLALCHGLVDPSASATAHRNAEILREYGQPVAQAKPRRITLRFLLSPVTIEGRDGGVSAVTLARNELVVANDGSLRARATDERVTIDAQVVFRAIGYRGTPLPGVPFDEERAVIANAGGRVLDAGEVRRGEYVVGWAKRGPSGVIGTNKKDAADTIDRLLEDLGGGRLLTPAPINDADLAAYIHDRAPDAIDYAGWERIDRHELALGAASGRPRVKLTRIEDMLEAARRK